MGRFSITALDQVSLTIQGGEFVAIMGPSGSGKSTLLHLMGGLDTPTSGEVYLNQQALSHLDDDQITLLRRQKIGFIFQFYNLLPTLNAAENVALPLIIGGQSAQQYENKVIQLLERVNLSDRMYHRPDQLSGGQKQRVAIARAFINQPEIVLADEPTGNLDSRSGSAILDLLRQACKDLATTIIMVTHDARAASYANRVIFLKDGSIFDQLVNGEGGSSVAKIMEIMAKLEL
jgi:putative ABC transport system ATP-binding protein